MKYGAFALICTLAMGFLFWNHSREAPPSRVVSDKNEKKPSINILVLGCDASGVRPDSILLVHVDASAGRIGLLSLPRDGKMRKNGRTRKLNTLLALENADEIKQEIEKLTGATIDHYIKVKLGTFAALVDALGGLEYEVEEDMYYRDPSQGLYIDLAEGRQTLNGDQCEQYCRFRGYAMGDLTRTERQRRLFSELLHQKLQLRYVLKFPALYNIMKENSATDISTATVAFYLPLVRDMLQGEVQIDGFECPGKYNDMEKEGVSYFIFDRAELQSLCKQYF